MCRNCSLNIHLWPGLRVKARKGGGDFRGHRVVIFFANTPHMCVQPTGNFAKP